MLTCAHCRAGYVRTLTWTDVSYCSRACRAIAQRLAVEVATRECKEAR